MDLLPKRLARTEHFQVTGHWITGYSVATIGSFYLGWTFHTAGELEYLISSLTEELGRLLLDTVASGGLIENRQPGRRNDPTGRTGLALRFAILKRDGYRCQLCGRTAQQHGVVLEIDHRIPRAKGGTDDPSNLWTLCFDCNRGKSDSDL